MKKQSSLLKYMLIRMKKITTQSLGFRAQLRRDITASEIGLYLGLQKVLV